MHLMTIVLMLVNLYQQILVLMLIHCHYVDMCIECITDPLVTVDDML